MALLLVKTEFHKVNILYAIALRTVSVSKRPCWHQRREAGDVWCLPAVLSIRAVIWSHFAISSLVLLPSPVTLSVLSFSACWLILMNFFEKLFQYFSLEIRFFVWLLFSSWEKKLVGGMCSMLPYGTGICCCAFIKYFSFFFCIASVHSFWYFF